MLRLKEKSQYLRNSRPEPCVGVTCNFINRRLQYRYFPANISKIWRIPISNYICEPLLLIILKTKRLLSNMSYIEKKTTQNSNSQYCSHYYEDNKRFITEEKKKSSNTSKILQGNEKKIFLKKSLPAYLWRQDLQNSVRIVF